MKDETKRKILKYVLFILYVGVFVYVRTVLHKSILWVFGAYVGITLVLIAVFYTTFLSFLGNYCYATGNGEKAKKYLKKAIDRGAKQPTCFLNYAVQLLKEGDLEAALSYLIRARQSNTNTLIDKNVMLSMGSCYMSMGQPEKAVEILLELKDKYEYVNGHVLTTLGYAYLMLDDYEKALCYTQEAVEEDAENGASWDNFGQIYYRKKEFDKALASFLKALECNPDLVDSNYYLGLIYEETGEIDKARERFVKAKDCYISALNTVTTAQVEAKYEQYREIKGTVDEIAIPEKP